MSRRHAITSIAALPLAGCWRGDTVRAVNYTGGWIGAQHERGHQLRDRPAGASMAAPALQGRASVLVIGAGVAGLACARALMRAGIDDVRVFDLEDTAGGNSRGHTLAGMACPRGAHYLPLPGEHATEVIELLEDLGLRRTVHGRAVYDERHLCHSPQERLHIDGQWHDGLLPPVEALPESQRQATTAQYQRLAVLIDEVSHRNAFALPTARAAWSDELEALDRITFTAWLDAQGLHAPALRWYLDHCCRDDYGAGAAQVSAWAGLHYFASRHGFQPPGFEARDGDHGVDGVLTWPEGNAWVTTRMAAPLGDRLRTGCVALRVDQGRHEVSVDLWRAADQRVERWTAPQVVLATPLFVSTRLLASPPAAWSDAATRMRHAPWLVANLHLDQPLRDHAGAPLSWDNVVYPGAELSRDASREAVSVATPADTAWSAARLSLGYVDAMHQSTRPHAGPTVLTAYWALGGDTLQQLKARRAALLSDTWSAWAARMLQDVARPHADMPAKVRQIDLMRYGHAMSVPAPGVRSDAALRAASQTPGRVHAAHSDLSGYSVFEEAMYWGSRAAQRVRSGLG
ncbi:MAG: FAD-dependent oxidoreductase [Pseudomonadota bacterium]|nr:FAD-dependent oxidoreductase [Pseudomonadota bacterium]